MKEQKMQTKENIDTDYIREFTHVVFDWDNTLKTYENGVIESRLSDASLTEVKDSGVQMFVISAIRPSSINLDTLMIEVNRLGLGEAFDATDSAEPVVQNGVYARLGNVIICGYNKAETFLDVCGYDAEKGHRALIYDDEMENVMKFLSMVPKSEGVLVV